MVLPLGSDAIFPLEIQIRTEKMHRLAEYGIAGKPITKKKTDVVLSALRIWCFKCGLHPSKIFS